MVERDGSVITKRNESRKMPLKAKAVLCIISRYEFSWARGQATLISSRERNTHSFLNRRSGDRVAHRPCSQMPQTGQVRGCGEGMPASRHRTWTRRPKWNTALTSTLQPMVQASQQVSRYFAPCDWQQFSLPSGHRQVAAPLTAVRSRESEVENLALQTHP